MFENILLDSSPRRLSVLHRSHYVLSALLGALLFVPALYLLPLMLAPTTQRPLILAASLIGTIASLYMLMLCYVWADARRLQLMAWPWVGIVLFLNLPGFVGYLAYSARKSGDWRRVAMPMAYITELLLVGALILVPLIRMQALPRTLLIVQDPIFEPPSPLAAPLTGQPASPQPHHATVDPFTQPVRIPPTIEILNEAPAPPEIAGPTGLRVVGVPGGFGSPDGVIGSVPWGRGTPPPPTVTHAAPKPILVRLSAPIVAAKGIYQPKPVYPHIAIISRTQGTVVLQAIIGKDGSIQDLKVVSGPALLVQAALDTVRTWRYQPTLLNSEPVDVLTEIDVNFRLDE